VNDATTESALSAWGLSGTRVTPIGLGHIHQTYRIDTATDSFVLQRINPMFAREVNLDIDAITRHLERQGLTTSRLVATRDGKVWHENDSGVWRLMTFIDGQLHESVTSPALARAAGALVGQFHRALSGFEHVFHFVREGAHETPLHLARLSEALERHYAHARINDIRPLAHAILARGKALSQIAPPLPTRIIHGDLKITNMIFDAQGTGIAIIDLDTMAHGAMAVELGDALRSWCNPFGEDDSRATFDRVLFRAAVEGIASGASGLLAPGEWQAIVPGTETIALELAARFCRDALEERYFGWDRTRFTTRADHNIARARAQLAVADSVRTQSHDLLADLRAV